jgi:glucose-1-phosphate cytidylyltransferase
MAPIIAASGDEPFERLIAQEELIAYRYDGFWEPMDTIKDKQRLDALADTGRPPWLAKAAPFDSQTAV